MKVNDLIKKLISGIRRKERKKGTVWFHNRSGRKARISVYYHKENMSESYHLPSTDKIAIKVEPGEEKTLEVVRYYPRC